MACCEAAFNIQPRHIHTNRGKIAVTMISGTSIRAIVLPVVAALAFVACDGTKPSADTSSENEKPTNNKNSPEDHRSAELQSVETGNPFREIFPREEYDKRLEAAEEYIKAAIRLAAETRQPAVGEKLEKVDEKLSLEKPGMRVGSILVRQGNQRSWARYLPAILVRPEPYTAFFIDPDDKEQQVELEPGLQKVTYSRVYRPDLAYLRNEIGKRDPKWDRHMVFAGLAFASNAKLTETALHHAIEAGYQEDTLTDFFKVVFRTFTKEGPAREMEKFLSHFEGKEIPWIYIPPLHNALVVTGRIDFMQRIAKEAGDNCVYDAAMLEQFLEWTGGETTWPEGSLLDRARANRGKSIAGIFKTSQRVQVHQDGKRKEDQLGPGPPVEEPFGFSSPPGNYFHVEYVSEDIPQNIHQHLAVKLQANGIDSGWQTKFSIDWVNLYSAKKPPPKNTRFYRTSPKTFLRFSTGTNYGETLVETAGNGMPGLILTHENIISIPFVENPILPGSLQEDFVKNKAKRSAEARVMEIDMIRYQSEIGIFVDGICYLHLPTDPKPKINIDLNIISLGMKVEIEEQAIWRLKD